MERNIFECFTFLSAIYTLPKKINRSDGNVQFLSQACTFGKDVSTLDAISSGRMELGIDAGWYEKEYFAYGYDLLSHKESNI